MTLEQKARFDIDELLTAAGWRVLNFADANIHTSAGVAILEAEVDTSLQRTQALRLATLAKAFSSNSSV